MIASYVMSYLFFIFYLFQLKTTSPQLSKLYTVTWDDATATLSFNTLIANAKIS